MVECRTGDEAVAGTGKDVFARKGIRRDSNASTRRESLEADLKASLTRTAVPLGVSKIGNPASLLRIFKMETLYGAGKVEMEPRATLGGKGCVAK